VELVTQQQPRLAEPPSSHGERKLDIKVIYTGASATVAALAAASSMARGLGARITILAAQVVPYPLSLNDPPVPIEFTERLLGSLTSELEDEAGVEIHLCRDRDQTLRQAVGSASVVVIGARKRWWPTAEKTLARMLRRDGRRVILVNT
jgi:hypothetical protein